MNEPDVTEAELFREADGADMTGIADFIPPEAPDDGIGEPCPTCEMTKPCVHRATLPAHEAYRSGKDAHDGAWENGLVPPSCQEALAEAGIEKSSDTEVWFTRGYQHASVKRLRNENAWLWGCLARFGNISKEHAQAQAAEFEAAEKVIGVKR